ncbi:MAG: cysteine--1-D-myo-inosityl 2-amino-2-deoxy-alpha-D-glucopyranoside ligase [Dermatophilaceae bacterium]
MKSWPEPFVPAVPGHGEPLRLHDARTGELATVSPDDVAGMYVCGITPYDATHLGHAATYVTFDIVGRALRDAGHQVRYVQNVTDVDDPLLERAAHDNRDWRELAAAEIALFREDMTALAVLPPDEFVGVTEVVPQIADAVRRLLDLGAAYRVPVPDEARTTGASGAAPGTVRTAASLPGGAGSVGSEPGSVPADVYLDVAATPSFGTVSGWSREDMLGVYADRGGDPDRIGKRDPLDPLLWRAARPGEPSWPDDVLGAGRPGWHVECTAIALDHLGRSFDVNGGGSDLVFPHHEMSAVQAMALTGGTEFARHFVHQAMVGLGGEKMSKSRGNLVLVSRLRADGVEPMAIRLLLLSRHYRQDWDYTPDLLDAAVTRLDRWRTALAVNRGADAAATISAIRARVADDLDTPGALAAVDSWCGATLAGDQSDDRAPGLVSRSIDRLLGIRW